MRRNSGLSEEEGMLHAVGFMEMSVRLFAEVLVWRFVTVSCSWQIMWVRGPQSFTNLQEQIPIWGPTFLGWPLNLTVVCRFSVGICGPMHIFCVEGKIIAMIMLKILGVGGIVRNLVWRAIRLPEFMHPRSVTKLGFFVSVGRGGASCQNDHFSHKLRTYKNHSFF
jgi:hypothetical protein